MGPHLFLALMRPYRPRQPWQDDVELIWAAAALIVLIVLLVWGVRQHLRKAKAEKHAALERVRAKRHGNRGRR